MQKIMLSVLLILAVFAVPMVAQDEPKKEEPKKEEPKADPNPGGIEPVEPVDPKTAEESEAYAKIQELNKVYRDSSKTRDERYKAFNEMLTSINNYVEKYWGVNTDRTKSFVSLLIQYYSRSRKYENCLKLTEKCLKADFYDEKAKRSFRTQRSEMYLNMAKFDLAIKEIKELKLHEGELDVQKQIENIVLLSLQARINLKTKKMDEYKKCCEKIEKLRKTITDAKAKQYAHYYVMKISEMAVVEGTVAPNWKAVDFEGKEVELSNYKGKYVLLDFWATWCGPCRSAMANHLKPMSEKYKGIADKFVIVSVGTSGKDTAEKQKAFVEKNGYTWDFVFDKDGTASESYGVMGIPTLVFVDPEGKIIFRGHGNVAEKVQEYLDKKFGAKEETDEEKPAEEEPNKDEPKKDDPKKEDF